MSLSRNQARSGITSGSGGSLRTAHLYRGRRSTRPRQSSGFCGGEDIESLSRELGVTATLSGWRDQFLAGGEANLKARETDVENEETQRLKSLVADLSMSNELLREKIHRMEAGRPLAWRRSKP